MTGRKLKLLTQVSIDGYLADSSGSTDWMVWNWGPNWNWDSALQKWFTGLTMSVGCILLSRKMAEEGFISHWKKVAQNSSDPQFHFASKIVKTPKIVFSRNLQKSDPLVLGWENATLVQGDAAAKIMELKRQEGADIIAYGGASFVSFLIESHLIDEFILVVNPVSLGSGMKIFHARTRLKLLGVHPYRCGIHVLTYGAA
jgi:dihydrofolate reductase